MDISQVEAAVAEAAKKAKPGYTIKIASRSKESVQVEIRETSGHLCWRAWNCETDFEWDFNRNVERYTN